MDLVLIRRLLPPTLIFLIALAAVGLTLFDTYWRGSGSVIELQGGSTVWDSGVVLEADEDYFHLRYSRPLSSDQRQELQARHGIVFLEHLVGYGWIVRRPSGASAAVLARLDNEAGVSLHRVVAENRAEVGLLPVSRLDPDSMQSLGSLDNETVTVLVTFQRDIPVTQQQSMLVDPSITDALQRTGPDGRPIWRVRVTPAGLASLTNNPTVRSIKSAGPQPQIDTSNAVSDVGGPLPSIPSITGKIIGLVELCAASNTHLAFGTRLTQNAVPSDLCRPIIIDRNQATGSLDQWVLWLDTNNTIEGDVCIWDGAKSPCAAPPDTTGADWSRINQDVMIDWPYARFIHIDDKHEVTDAHYRICTNLSIDTLSGCDPIPGGPAAYQIQPRLRLPAENAKKLNSWAAVAHPTHVAGIMIGDGTDATGTGGAGLAPAMAVRSFETGPDESAVYSTYTALMNHDIQVINNSWGLKHGFDTVNSSFWLSQYYDILSSGLMPDGTSNIYPKRVLLVGSAGNRGHYPGSAVERFNSARLGNSSKNSIAVANLRKDDILAADSSRGPTNDGRLTPLITATGGSYDNDDTQLTSTLPFDTYDGMAGTSQAAPLVTAAAAVVASEQTTMCKTHGGSAGGATPGEMNPALVRAILTHTASPLGPPGPDFRTGFGQLNAFAAFNFAKETRFQTHTIRSGLVEYVIDVEAADLEGDDLRVTLAWDDRPWLDLGPMPAGHPILQADLDLELLGPDGRRYLPWVLDPGNPGDAAEKEDLRRFRPVPVSDRDHRNTIEQVVVSNAPTGRWRIRVRLEDRLQAGLPAQQFSLVSSVFGDNTECIGITPNVRTYIIWLPSDPFRWRLFFAALIFIVLLLVVTWLEVRYPKGAAKNDLAADVPLTALLWRFLLFVLLLTLIFFTLFHWQEGLAWIGYAIGAVLIGGYLYATDS